MKITMNGVAKVQMGVLLCLYASAAFAGSMPWDGPLCTIANALTGKAAFAIAIAAFFGAGAKMVWGEELTGMTKTLLSVVMAISILIGGAAIVRFINPSAVTC
ncbi:TrbC/VirB2 family protein [Aquitalea palustris]|uniref:TrbC/VirB2 family protein n=1 Tax=Aquitalea palustris TaxID=2480983 RepID=UPI001CF08887|nr:TrbC/VirB2 family protein [Aquitalea palustris]